MAITHVFRGDEHVNNTPWQINIFHALGAPLPVFAHVPVILGDDGQKLSKRRGAVSVTAYDEAGYLPEAMLNYLARLGWSHGDDELFSREQLVQWFDGQHLSKSPAQWDAAKLRLGQRALHQARPTTRRWRRWWRRSWRGAASTASPARRCARLCALFKDRCATTVELADWLAMYFAPVDARGRDVAPHVTAAVRRRCATLRDTLAGADWNRPAIAPAIKETLAAHGLKMPQLAHGGARARVRPAADAVARCGARALPPRHRARALAEGLKSLAIIGLAWTAMATHGVLINGSARGYSSAGRALAWHARGQRFDPAYLHHNAGSEQRDRATKMNQSPSSRGLGHHPFTVITGVRIP